MQALDALASRNGDHEDCWTLKALDALAVAERHTLVTLG